MRSIAFTIALFFTAVILPNKIGTPELPALGTKQAIKATSQHSIGPGEGLREILTIGRQLAILVPSGRGGAQCEPCGLHGTPTCRLRI